MSSVTLSKIQKTYPGGNAVVHGIDLEIKEGEFMVLVGPSGCGKSTTLRMIAGLEDITGGELKIGGKVVNDTEPKARNIAMVFQNYALYPHMSVYENISFGLKLAKLPKEEIDARVQEVAKTLEIEHLLQRKPKDMSGGQRQRVALGRAIARRAQVYLFDEPLSNLDAQLRVSMRVRLAQLHTDLKKAGLSHTMIYVTHDQTEAMTLGHRICVMEAGYIRQVDTPLNLYKYPANKFVAEFIGSPSMNFVTAGISKKGDSYFASFEGFSFEVPSEKSKNLESYVGKTVILGVRAEHIEVSEKASDNSFPAQVSVAERMGNEDFIYFPTGGVLLVARTSLHMEGMLSGKTLYFTPKADEIHLFDPNTEQTISLPDDFLGSVHKPIQLPDSETLKELLGGEANIVDAGFCSTRVRLEIKDLSKINRSSLAAFGGQIIYAGGQKIHILAGQETAKLFTSFKKR